MIDLHSHILPMVDDGASSISETVAILEKFARLGYSRIVATPHWAAGMPDVPATVIDEVATLGERIGIHLSVARECRIHPNLLTHIDRSPNLRVDGGNVVLVELPWGPVPTFTTGVFHALQRAGYRPVLVHPERHANLWEKDSPLDQLIDAGVPLQVNISSFVGHYGKGARDRAVALLQRGAIALVATDIHSPVELADTIPAAHRMLGNLVGKDVAAILTTHNPAALISNQPVTDLRLPAVGLFVDTSVLRSGGSLSGILGKSMQGLRAFARGSS